MLYELTVPQFKKMLLNLDLIMDKALAHAQEKKFEPEVLLQARLAPDQFNFIRQVQIACDTAKLGCSRLTGKEAPTHADDEKTFPQLKTRIEQTITFLNTLTVQDFKDSENKKITNPRWENKYMLGGDFAMQHMIPNIYFHVTTAYAILRHNGVNIGKKDYLGQMPYKV